METAEDYKTIVHAKGVKATMPSDSAVFCVGRICNPEITAKDWNNLRANSTLGTLVSTTKN